MNIGVLCNSDTLAIPSLYKLREKGWLVGVAIPERSRGYLQGSVLQAGFGEQDIAWIPTVGRAKALADWVVRVGADAVLVFTFPWRLPAAVLALIPGGFFNVHFGPLPVYQGADPIFWLLKNREEQGAITVHRMTTAIDRGPIVWQQTYPMMAGETYGMLCQRVGLLTMQLVEPLIERLAADALAEEAQPEAEARYFDRPGAGALSIDWEQHTGSQIEWLVNACNPRYGGASTSLRSREIRILEVAPATVEQTDGHRSMPGTIVYADAVYGLIVACMDNTFLRVNVVQLPEGYFSGSKLFGIGIKAGEQFITIT